MTRRSLLRRLLLACLLAGAAVPAGVTAQSPKPSQYDVQAVYLYDFAKFVRWPGSSGDSTLDLCLAGAGKGLTAALQHTVAGESIGGRQLRVRAVDSTTEEQGCDLLFLDNGYRAAPALLAAAAGKPILTVSDGADFVGHGGMIQLVTQDAHVRFLVNLTPVSTSGLTLSSELLKVALRVDGRAAASGGGR